MTIRDVLQLKKEKADPFLALFPPNYRGAITNFVLAPIRKGITTHQEAVMFLKNELRQKWYPLTGSAHAMEKEIENPLLVPMFEYYLFYENLPYKIKQQIKKAVLNEFWRNKSN